jgi:hypothetical protein
MSPLNIVPPLNSVPFFEKGEYIKKEHYSNFCTFEIASLAIVPGHYSRKYGIGKNQKLCQNKIQNGETLPKLNIGNYSKFGQYYRYEITMYDFIYIIQFLIPIFS